MRPPAATPTTYYPALTGLRALAALAVFGFHHRTSPLLGTSAPAEALRAVLGELHTGVSVFFTLSGFLITKRYAHQRFGPAAWGRYLGHRAARIMPVYAGLLVVTFVVEYGKHGGILWRWLALFVVHLTLLKGLVERWALSGITQAWSLTVEEGFYLLAPLVFWLGWRYRPRWAWPLLAAGLLALGGGIYWVLPQAGSPMFVLKATIFGRLPEFLLGAAFAWSPPRTGRRWATTGGVVSSLLVLALLVGVQQSLHRISLDSRPGVLLNNWLLPVATGWLLHGLATEPTRLSRLLATPLWQQLGRASYCFYLLHMGVLPDALALLLQRLPAGWAALASFGLLIAASLLLHKYVEQPAHRWLLAQFARRGAVPVAA